MLTLVAATPAPPTPNPGPPVVNRAVRLRVEYLENPINIDVPIPRFSWACESSGRATMMTGFFLTVDEKGATESLWKSGLIQSARSVNIEYQGPPLASDRDFTWTVVWYDQHGVSSQPATGSFSTALLNGAADSPAATWITPASGANLLRAEFSLPLDAWPQRGRLYISGLGFYHAWINGVPTDDHQVGQFLTFEKRVAYDVVDVTALLRPGCNAMGVSLGTGWYNQSSILSGPKSLWLSLRVDGTEYVSSLTQGGHNLVFTSTAGPVTMDEIYLGENYDARLEQPGWTSCNFVPPPGAKKWLPCGPARNATATALFVSQKFLVRPDRTYSVINITQPVDGQWVFDFGQNIAGITTFRVTCPSGPQTIYMSYGESLQIDGTVLNQYGFIMMSQYTCAGTGEEEVYTTQHTQYAFRFVQISNFPSIPTDRTFTAYFIHADIPQASIFNTDNMALNQIQSMTRFAAMSNQMDIPTDCPQRERRGWLGDAQLSCETNIYNEDMSAFYTKWMFDVQDSQNAAGAIPDCAPFYGHGAQPGDPAWSVAFPAIVNWVSSYMDDDRIVSVHYDGIKAYIESEIKQLDPTGVLSFAYYGDWCSAADGFATGNAFKRADISTFMFLWGVDILADFATRLGKTDDATKYSNIAENTRGIYNKYFFNAMNSSYSDGYPISQLLALSAPGLIPSPAVQAAVVNALLFSIRNGTHSGYANHTTGGIIFMKYAFDVLTANGHITEALNIFLNTGFPSIRNWVDQPVPATTLWENWQSSSTVPYGSYNHIMYGGFGAWLYRGVGGLNRASGSRGWTNLSISPPNPSDVSQFLTQANTEVDTPIGIVSVLWDSRPSSEGSLCGLFPEHTYANFTCSGGTFTGVQFASFGTPKGACPNFTTGTCNALNSTQAVAEACVGKSSCSIPVDVDYFGDPCYGTAKHLAVFLKGASCTNYVSVYTLQTTIPANAVATVGVPLTLSPFSPSLQITEGILPYSVIWENGAFIKGAAEGVTSGAAASDGKSVLFQVGSGRYNFNVRVKQN